MSYNPNLPAGQAAMAASSPVVIASDQSAVPVSGTVTANIGTVATLATAAKQDTGNTSLSSIDGKITAVDTGAVVVSSSALPSGASTSAKQDTIITHVDGIEGLLTTIDTDTGGIATSTASIDTKTPALGQALAAASVPVVLTAAQITTLTPVSTVTANAGTNLNTSALALETTATSIKTAVETLDNIVSGSEAQVDIVAALPAGTNNIGDVDVASIAAGDNNIGNVDIVSLPASTNTIEVVGDAAHDAAIAGNPIIVGGVSSAAAPASVSADQEAVRAWYLRNGAQATVVTAAGALIGGDATNGLDVDVTRIASGAIQSGALASGSIASGAIASGAIASGAIAAGAIAAGATSIATTEDTASAAADHLVKVAQIRLDTPVANANLSNDGDYTQFLADNFGKTWVSGTVPEDVAHIGGESIQRGGARRIDTAATSAGTSGDWATMDASAEGALWVTNTPTTTSGCSIFKSIDLDESEEEVKATAGNVYGYYVFNAAASVAYLKFYNATAANVTVGTTTPVMTFPVPAGSAANVSFAYPISFGTAICAAVTTGLADADTGAPAANAFIANIFYK